MSIGSFLVTTQQTLGELLEPNDFNISTWMAAGACIMLLGQRFLPYALGSWLPVVYLIYRFVKMLFDTARLHTGSYTSLVTGRWTASLSAPNEHGDVDNSRQGVVLFILGARINHPLGKLSPGAAEINDALLNMWAEAEANRQKWGYLGRTEALVDYSDSERTPTFWLTYWKDLKGLQEFSHSAVHRFGRDNYNTRKYPYMGIMHETFVAPKGCWETLYEDFPRWGLGSIKYLVQQDTNQLEDGSTLKPVSRGSTMIGRMGQANSTK